MNEATLLIESGYRAISNTHRTVARIDRPDWRRHMAHDHVDGFRGDPDENLREGMQWVDGLGDGAADFYRRVLSQDRLSGLRQDIYDEVKKAGHGSGWGGLNEYLPINDEQESAET